MDAQYICPLCDDAFYDKDCFVSHISKHSGTRSNNKVLLRLINANESLAEISENKITYYEDSPLRNPECSKRWEELNDALREAKESSE